MSISESTLISFEFVTDALGTMDSAGQANTQIQQAINGKTLSQEQLLMGASAAGFSTVSLVDSTISLAYKKNPVFAPVADVASFALSVTVLAGKKNEDITAADIASLAGSVMSLAGDALMFIPPFTAAGIGLRVVGAGLTFGSFAYTKFSEDEIKGVKQQFNAAQQAVSPLILDLDGDGVETLGLASNIHFDHDGNSFAEQTGWVGKDDGMLVLDRNNNGLIDNGNELFGNNTKLANGATASNGFAALAGLDSNHDNLINNDDAAFANLRVWKDLDSDGVTDAGELLTLIQAGVKSINTVYTSESTIDINGNADNQQGSYTQTSGTIGQVHDIWFNTDYTYTVDKNTVAVSAEIAALPDIQGFGNVANLQQAMARDNSGQLKALVKDFVTAANGGESIVDLSSRIQGIIYQWTGSNLHALDSRGSDAGDAWQIYVVEAFMGQGFMQPDGSDEGVTSNPGPNALTGVISAYEKLSNAISLQLFSATLLKPLLNSITYSWSSASSSMEVDVSQTLILLSNKYAVNHQDGLIVMNMLGKLLLNQGAIGENVVKQLRSAGNLNGGEYQKALAAIGVGDIFKASLLTGTAGNDSIAGSWFNDLLSGGMGNDTLNGGSGKDTLRGDVGDDVYLFGKGDGSDVIDSSYDTTVGKLNTLQLKAGITPADVMLKQVRSNYKGAVLEVSIIGTTDKITIDGVFYNDDMNSGYSDLQQIKFSDGTIWDLNTIKNKLFAGTSGADWIYGLSSNDTLTGQAGADYLRGNKGNDHLDGGVDDDLLIGDEGNDTLSGAVGNDSLCGDVGDDVYLFGKGDGQDYIGYSYDTAVGKLNTLQLGAGIAPTDVVLKQAYVDYELVLEVLIVGTADKVSISHVLVNEMNSAYCDLQQIKFSDGTIWDLNTIKTKVFSGTNDADLICGLIGDDVLAGQEGADSLQGNAGNDCLDGGADNDTLRGNAGNDTLIGGFGNDLLSGDLGDDHLEGGMDNDRLSGDAGNDTLNGSAGKDSLSGGIGDDVYLFGKGDGQDLIDSTYDITVGKLNTLQLKAGVIPADVLLKQVNGGGFLEVSIVGTSDTITINGVFSDGNLNSVFSDFQQIKFSDGTIWDLSTIKSKLFAGTSGADLMYGLSSNDTLMGQAGADSLHGNAGDDRLDGGADNDTLIGGVGNDVYLFGKGDGQDLINYTFDAAGGKLNILQLKAGVLTADVLLKQVDDGYWGDQALEVSIVGTTDKIIIRGVFYKNDMSNNLNDLQQIKFSDGTIWDLSTIKSKLFAGTSGADLIYGLIGNDTLMGQAGADYLKGNAGDDRLDGGVGADSLLGGLGNDVFVVDNAGDLIIENLNEGVDTIQSSVSVSTLTTNVENFILTGTVAINGTGNELANFMVGNSANNLLSGGLGGDIIRGGLGNDTLDGGDGGDWVDYRGMTAAVMVNLSNTSTAQNTGAAGLDLLTNFENIFGGSGNDTLIGSLSANIIRAGLGNDSLDGGAGIDYVDYRDFSIALTVNLGLTSAQNTGAAGVDTLINFENLLGGVGNDTLSGNALANRIEGNAGNDLLSGSMGNDALLGGVGSDTYRFARTEGQDVVSDTDATAGNSDVLAFQTGITNDQLWFKHSANDLVVSVIGTMDRVTIKDWYASGASALNTASVIESISAGGKVLSHTKVEALVGAMAAFTAPAVGQTTLPSTYQSSLHTVIAANWQ